MSQAVLNRTHVNSLLAAVHASPFDDALRLIFADHLAESGEPADLARAEFIRVQLALARLSADHSRTSALVSRQADLLQQYHTLWTEPVKGFVSGVEFRRGFLDAVSVDAGQFLEMGEELFRRVPIRKVRLLNTARHWDRLVSSPLLGNIRELDLAGTDLGNGGLNVFLRSPFLAGIENLDLSFNGLDDRSAALLGDSRSLTSLQSLTLTDNRIGSMGAQRIAEANWYAQLQWLDLTANAVTETGIQALLHHAPRILNGLRLSSNPLGPIGVQTLLQSPVVGQLLKYESRLDLRSVDLGSQGCASLSRSPYLHVVTRLDLSENEIDSHGVRLFTTGSYPRLRQLNLRSNWIDDDGGIALARSPIMKTLVQLDLANNKLTQLAADELLTARRSPQTIVDLSGNFIEEK